jgi:hypothetical protein
MGTFSDRNIRNQCKAAGRKLIRIAPAVLGLLLLLGLLVDLGQIFLARGYLRRAADAAAQAAAFRLREDADPPELTAAALAATRANGIDPASVRVDTCDTDPSLCPPEGGPAERRVRVTIEADFSMTFAPLPYSRKVRLGETGVSLAAAMDVVLVIDVSESMAWDTAPYPALNYDEDPANPAVCNLDDSCHPFQEVKAAAADFAALILDQPPAEEPDRLAVVTFANGWEDDPRGTQVMLGGNWTNDSAVALDPGYGIPSLKVYDPGAICPLNDFACGATPGTACPATVDDIPTGPCIYVGPEDLTYHTYPFWGFNCARLWDIDTADGDKWEHKDEAISACTTTNTGGALHRAAVQFHVAERTEALRVVVLLTDGAANATFGVVSDVGLPGGNTLLTVLPIDPADFIPNLPLGFCPDGTWIGRGTGHNNRMYCQDGDVDTYHLLSVQPELYDADDFARDQARFVACSATDPSISCNGILGQDAAVFTIGLGSGVLELDDDPVVEMRKPYGASLLRFIAALGDDGDADTDLCATEYDFTVSCGNYYYAPGGADLDEIFDLIYERIVSPLLPAAFEKLGPADGAYASTNPALAWNAVINAESYEYCFDTTDDDACGGSWSSAGTSTGAPLSGLTEGETYYWQARAVNAHGSTEADGGDWWSFTARRQSFADVPAGHPFWQYIEAFYSAGITTGCGVSPLIYCPEQNVTRAAMAVFLLRAKYGSSYAPPAASHYFADLPVAGKEWQEAWVDQLYREGITTGCGTGPLIYCPETAVTRAAMAVFILRAKYGSSYTPPAASHYFADLPVTGTEWMEPWVDQLYREGITTGCGVSPLIFCPEAPVKRQAIAAFIVRAFNLPLP